MCLGPIGEFYIPLNICTKDFLQNNKILLKIQYRRHV